MLANAIGPREDYQIVKIRIFAPAAPGEGYPIELKVLDGPEFPDTLQLDLTELDALAADPRAYGQALGEALFADTALGRAYREAIATSQGRGHGLRVRLRLDAPDLHAVHWERVYHPLAGVWRPLGSTATTPFSRYVQIQGWDRPEPMTERPLRVLAVIASPIGLDGYSLDPIADEERQTLHDTLDGLPDVVVTYLEIGTARPPTLNQMCQSLTNGYHVVHLLCHGAVTPGGSVLYLEDEAGTVDPVHTDRFVDSFKALASPPLLCFLAACESGARGRHDAFVPLGPALVQDGGIHAVVAMTDRVGLATAQLFADQFYTRLLTHGTVDLAVNEARALIRDEWDWGVPVLFSRLSDNQLIDRSEPGKPPPADTAAVDKRDLREQMVQAFSIEDLEVLCNDVQLALEEAGIQEQVNLEIVGGSGKRGKVLNLIQFLDRRGYLGYLVDAVRSHRPGLV